MNINSGVQNTGGGNITIGSHNRIGGPIGGTAAEHGDRKKESKGQRDVGLITIQAKETQSVKSVLGLRSERIGDLSFDTGTVGDVSVVATRALAQGQRSTIPAYWNLVNNYDPEIVVLVGIGGGIHEGVVLGDVVVSTEVVYYDLRQITPKGQRRRGEERAAPAAVGHSVNRFFTDHDLFTDNDSPSIEIEDPTGRVRTATVYSGPIGSGEAVIADEEADELAYLASFNEKILAIDTEAGALAQACYEQSAASGRQHKWAVVRGISDKADSRKRDEPQRIAAWHAATVLRALLPYLSGQTKTRVGDPG